jgi:hypothetical protein
MAYERRTYAGGAAPATLTGAMDASVLSATLSLSTGWGDGVDGPFGAVIGRGTDTEEKILIESRAASVITIASGGRGVDGTTAVAHSAGDTIELCLLARDLDEANAHIADTSLDHHSQYLDTDRHDVTARHAFGDALGTPDAAEDIGTAASAGSGSTAAREDHVHRIPAGLVTRAMVSGEEWTDWSPTYGGLSVGDGTAVARYTKRGLDVTARFSLAFGSTTAVSSDITVNLPFAVHASGYAAGHALAYDVSTDQYFHGTAFVSPGSAVVNLAFGVELAAPTQPFTWTNTDVLAFTLTYESAA